MTSSSRNRETLLWVRLGLLTLGVAGIGSFFGLWHVGALVSVLPDLCPVHRWTHHQCPTAS